MRVIPISCRCYLEVDYVPEKPGEYQLLEVLRRCADHQNVADDALLAVIYGPSGECRTLTSVRNVLLRDEFGLAETNADGQRVLREDVAFDSWFEGVAPNRQVRYTLVGPTIDAQVLGDVVVAVEAATPAGSVGIVDVAEVLAPASLEPVLEP